MPNETGNKEQKKNNTTDVKGPKVEAQKDETKKTSQPEDKKPPESKTEKNAKKSHPTNCIVCNKAFKYKRWYYKNGKYFCSKRCWKKFEGEKKKEAAEKVTKDSQEKDLSKESSRTEDSNRKNST